MKNKNSLPELLAPAGNMERFDSALLYGADAVYLGGKDQLNLRHKALGFSWEELDEAIKKAKKVGVKIYYCLNVFPRQKAFASVEESLERLADLSIDGLIIADPGVLRMARELAPDIEIHLSTQSNTASGEAAVFWHEQGVSRVNLARELDLYDLRTTLQYISEHAPALETEIFVHGAMCLAISGQCLLSAWLNRRPGNLGQCTHPCRFEYRAVEMGLSGLRVEEVLREGESLWEIADNEDGFSAFWSPNDLCLVKYLSWFRNNGVSALKLEGRMRTATVVGQMVNVYRTALNDLSKGFFRPDLYLQELSCFASRPLDSGFFLPCGRRKIFFTPECSRSLPVVTGVLHSQNAPDCWKVFVKSRWSSLMDAEILMPGLNNVKLPAGQYFFENHRGEKTTLLHSGTWATVHIETVVPALQSGLFIRSCQPLEC